MLGVTIEGETTLPAEYEVTANCTELISKLESRRFTLSGKETRTLNFSVNSETHIRSNHSCNISLFNSVPELLDHQWLNFSTIETQYEAPQVDNSNYGNLSENVEDTSTFRKSESGCEVECPDGGMLCSMYKGCSMFSFNFMLPLLVLLIFFLLCIAGCVVVYCG